jgi:hypothetical protein
VAYTNLQGPYFRFASTAPVPASCKQTPTDAQLQAYYPCTSRIPVFSTGISFRMNVMGYAILEAYMAHPFQRPSKNWVWGFQLAPGW